MLTRIFQPRVPLRKKNNNNNYTENNFYIKDCFCTVSRSTSTRIGTVVQKIQSWSLFSVCGLKYMNLKFVVFFA